MSSETLSGVSLFGALSPETRQRLAGDSQVHDLTRGEILIREGESGESLFVVLNGRLRAYVNDDNGPRVVGEISAGETVGEMAALSDQPRSASVRAIRPSRVLEISREAFHRHVEQDPRALAGIARTIIERLTNSIHRTNSAGAVKTLALIPAGRTGDIDGTARKLAEELSGAERVMVATGLDAPTDPAAFLEWVGRLEAAHDKVLLVGGPEADSWTERCLGQADRILLIADPGADPALNRTEEHLLAGHDPHTGIRVDLILEYRQGENPRNSQAWTTLRPNLKRFNIRENGVEGPPRLARLLTGRFNSLVLSGGGARGLAHIGVLRALEEARIPIDLVGGSSFGAVIAAHCATGQSWEQTNEAAVDSLVRLGSPLDLTPPLVALARGAKVRRQLHHAFGAGTIENLWLNYFCVSSNLTRGEVEIHQTGPIWEALRASVAIPGVFAPMRSNAGEVLVDGAVMNNLPVDVAQRLGEPGPVMAVNLRGTVTMAAGDLPNNGEISGWRALRHRTRRKRPALPGIVDTLLRTSEIGSVVSARTFEALADIVFRPPVSEYPLMDFSKHEELVDAGYRHARSILQSRGDTVRSLQSDGGQTTTMGVGNTPEVPGAAGSA